MLDFSFLPPLRSGDLQVFNIPSSSTVYYKWTRPRGTTMGLFVLVGAGGGGGGGRTKASGTAGGGGGGGGSGSVSRMIVPLSNLPSVLYVQPGSPGAGGAGGATGVTGGTGSYSYIYADSYAESMVIGASGGSGGVGGSASAGTGGAAGPIFSYSFGTPIFTGSIYNLIAGQAGANGGATNTAGTNITIPLTSLLTTGGCGGAGSTAGSFAGGGFSSATGAWVNEVPPSPPSAGANKGSDGYFSLAPFFSFGGCGGSSINNTTAGAGGNGAYGSGGGGGGAGLTGGRGGDGGGGIIFIFCW